jgi:hypothetical protein
MLIDFRIENFRSYKEARKFSMVASNVTEHLNNVIDVAGFDLSLLKSAVIYGANASGKSNLLLAAFFLGSLLRDRANYSAGGLFQDVQRGFSTDAIDKALPFLLDREMAAKPSKFYVNFFCDGVRYEYGLSIKSGSIEEEWLSAFPEGREQRWFNRSLIGDNQMYFSFPSPHLKGAKKQLTHITSPNIPFLSVAASFGHSQLTGPAQWLFENLRELPSGYSVTAERCFNDKEFNQWVVDFLKYADLGIRDLKVNLIEKPIRIASSLPEELRSNIKHKYTEYRPQFIHSGEGEAASTPFDFEWESAGTKHLFRLLAPWYTVLKTGKVAFIDELGTSMHPLLVRQLIRLFHEYEFNKTNAQLILTTHDTSLLSASLFRRDQVWFAEKDKSGATDLYSLHDFHPRQDESFEKGYLSGRYGAIPFLGELHILSCRGFCGHSDCLD